jgi:hypothetical protein
MNPRTTALAAVAILLSAACPVRGGGAVTFIPAAKKDKGHFIGASVFQPGTAQAAQEIAMPQSNPEYQPSEIPPSNVAADPAPPRFRATSVGDVQARRDPPVARGGNAGTIVLEPVIMIQDGNHQAPPSTAEDDVPSGEPEDASPKEPKPDHRQDDGTARKAANPLARLAQAAESVKTQHEQEEQP